MNPIFWQPTNLIGKAGTIDTTFEGQPIKINFYWSGVELSVDPQTDEQLTAQIIESLEKHPLAALNGKNVFHLMRMGDRFGEITDPGWISPARA